MVKLIIFLRKKKWFSFCADKVLKFEIRHIDFAFLENLHIIKFYTWIQSWGNSGSTSSETGASLDAQVVK